MSPLLFYQQQAAQQSTAAEQATLQNVRERCQRAAEAWATLAARSERADHARAQAASEKLASGVNDDPADGLEDA